MNYSFLLEPTYSLLALILSHLTVYFMIKFFGQKKVIETHVYVPSEFVLGLETLIKNSALNKFIAYGIDNELGLTTEPKFRGTEEKLTYIFSQYTGNIFKHLTKEDKEYLNNVWKKKLEDNRNYTIKWISDNDKI